MARADFRILVTDAAERSMLATCRGLTAAGYRVSAAAYSRLAAAQWSRCCSEGLLVTDPRVDAGAFVAGLRRHLQRRPYDMLLAGSDFSLMAVSRHRRELDGLTRLTGKSRRGRDGCWSRRLGVAPRG